MKMKNKDIIQNLNKDLKPMWPPAGARVIFVKIGSIRILEVALPPAGGSLRWRCTYEEEGINSVFRYF